MRNTHDVKITKETHAELLRIKELTGKALYRIVAEAVRMYRTSKAAK